MGFFDKLKKINIFASFGSELTDDFYDELEESLILADTGMDTTLELVEIIKSAMPPAALREKQHPAKRSFQAIRIAVNGELDALPPMLRAAVDGLNPGGRLAVITFHSLEDRLVKNKFRRWSTACTCPPEFPVCVCGGKAKAKLITRKPIEADQQELEENRRSRSAHLRVLEKL